MTQSPSRIGVLPLRAPSSPWTDRGYIEKLEGELLLLFLNHYHIVQGEEGMLPLLDATGNVEGEEIAITSSCAAAHHHYNNNSAALLLPVVFGVALHRKFLSNRLLLFNREVLKSASPCLSTAARLQAGGGPGHDGYSLSVGGSEEKTTEDSGGKLSSPEPWPGLLAAAEFARRKPSLGVGGSTGAFLEPDHQESLNRKLTQPVSETSFTPSLHSWNRGKPEELMIKDVRQNPAEDYDEEVYKDDQTETTTAAKKEEEKPQLIKNVTEEVEARYKENHERLQHYRKEALSFWETWFLHSLRQGVVPRQLRANHSGGGPTPPSSTTTTTVGGEEDLRAYASSSSLTMSPHQKKISSLKALFYRRDIDPEKLLQELAEKYGQVEIAHLLQGIYSEGEIKVRYQVKHYC